MKWPAIILILTAVGCSSLTTSTVEGERESAKTYHVIVSDTPLDVTLDGVNDDPVWARAEPESRFCFPWLDKEIPRTVFAAACDRDYLYFYFDVEDGDIVLDHKTEGE